MLYSKHLAEGALVARDPLCRPRRHPCRLACTHCRPYTCCMQHCGRSDSDMQQTSSPKTTGRPQGPEHPGHWRSGQARAGMGLKLKEEAKNSKEESIKIFAAAHFKAALRRKASQCAVVKVFNSQTAMLLSACCLLDSTFIS